MTDKINETQMPLTAAMLGDRPPVDKPVDSPKPVDAKPSVNPVKPAVDKPASASRGVMHPQHDIPKVVDPRLVHMLCWPRNHGSPEEIAFAGWLLDLLKSMGHEVRMHAEGAMSVTIPYTLQVGTGVNAAVTAKTSSTLFSCHIDTVDSKMVSADSRKKLTYDPAFGQIALDSQSVGNCLGADDTAGIFLLLSMIESKVPGTYMFHRGEEAGGVSAKAIARKEEAFLSQFQIAVAFDRKETGDIVTVQGGMRCASEKFAKRLAEMLGEHGMSYKESLTGSYTDVKDYRGVIAEVVNLSCGYEGAHGRGEVLDYGHLCALKDALRKIDWEALPVDRDPKAKEVQTWRGGSSYYGGGGYGGRDSLFSDDEDRQWGGSRGKNGAKGKGKGKTLPVAPKLVETEIEPHCGFHDLTLQEISDAVQDDPSWTLEQILHLLRENARLRGDVNVMSRLLDL